MGLIVCGRRVGAFRLVAARLVGGGWLGVFGLGVGRDACAIGGLVGRRGLVGGIGVGLILALVLVLPRAGGAANAVPDARLLLVKLELEGVERLLLLGLALCLLVSGRRHLCGGLGII